MKSIVLLSILALSGCATTLHVTYQSEPAGAALYQNGALIGYTPLTLDYRVPAVERHGVMQLQGTEVHWASGARAQVSSLTADIGLYGRYQQFTFSRPDAVPGRAYDVQVGLQLQQLALMQAQLSLQQQMAVFQAAAALGQPTNMSCRSTVVGNMVNTHCF